MKISSENIDELMFQLLEGDIQGAERNRLLDAIAADKQYSIQWQAWQKTVLNPNDELIVMPIAPLLKKRKAAVFWSWKYGVAAMVCLTVGASVFYLSNKNERAIVVSEVKPKNPKLEVIKVPNNEPVSNQFKTKDTILTFKQKIQMMAHHENKVNKEISAEIKMERPKEESEIALLEVKKEFEIPSNTPVMQQEKLIEMNPVSKISEVNNLVVTSYSESIPKTKKTDLNQEITEKKNLLARIFSKPNFKLTSDSANFKNRKLIIENKAYKIIAGF